MTTTAQNIDWSNLTFGYMKTDYRFVSNYKDGKWDEGTLTTDETITLNESAGVLQYAQTCFEGLKAYRTVDGHIVCFRPDMNAKRMAESAKRLEMPVFPEDRFVEAVKQVVKANKHFVPPYGTGATLYLRPYMFGSNAVIGVKPATEYQFRIFATPVGPYFKGGAAKPITLRVPDFDRAAPHGTGHVKAGLNYAMSLHAIVDAHNQGYSENMYLDSATRTKVEETGGANIIFVKDGTVVTPKSNTILPSITRRSLMYVAEHYLGLKAEEREVYADEIKNFDECALCGTAAVLSPVGRVVDHGKDIFVAKDTEKAGEITQKLYDTLTGIQMGRLEAPEGWIEFIE